MQTPDLVRRIARPFGRAGHRLRTRLDQSPDRGPGSLAVPPGSPLVVIDGDVSPEVVSGLLAASRPGVVLVDRDPKAMLLDPSWRIHAPEDLHGVGGPEDERRAGLARSHAAGVIAAVLPVLPHELTHTGGVRVVEDVLRFELQQKLFGRLRVLASCQRVLENHDYDHLILVRGDGQLTSLTQGLASHHARTSTVLEWDATSVPPGTSPTLRPVDIDRPTGGGEMARAPLPRPPAAPTRAEAGTRPSAAQPSPAGRTRPLVLAWPLRNHTLSMVPVVTRLAQGGQVTVAPLSDRKKHRALFTEYRDLAAGGALTLIDDLARPGGAYRDGAMVARCDEAAADAGSCVDRVDLGPLEELRQETRDLVTDLLQVSLPSMHGFAAAVRRSVHAHEVGVVVISRERGWKNRLGALVADDEGVPTVTVQASLLSSSARHAPLPTGHATVLDAFARTLHIEHFAADPDGVHVTGFPSFDALRRSSFRSDAGPAVAPTVLLAMQRSSLEESARLIAAVVRALESGHENARLVVKAHPKSSPATLAHYRAAVASSSTARERHEVRADGDIHRLIDAADLVVSWSSTTLIEAALLGCPALAVSQDGEPLPLPFVEMGVADGVWSTDALNSVLPRLLEAGPERAALKRCQATYVEDNPHLLGGPSATERIAAIVTDLAQRPARAV
jgi:hypothetical protein